MAEELVLVTGVTGYIASHIVNQLLQQNYKVRGTLRDLKDVKNVTPIQKLASGSREGLLELIEADLLDPECWLSAVDGCKYVIHTASPFPSSNPKSEDELLRPAVDGTLNVLKACGRCESVERVVVTSSAAAISAGHDPKNRVFNEDDWANIKSVEMPYEKSKLLAERAAWDYMKSTPAPRFGLAVINPVLVMGPILCGKFTTSMEIPKRLLSHEMPMLAAMNFPICDVRDVATAHLTAMRLPEAVGNRHVICTGDLWMAEIAKILQDEFGKQGYSIPHKVAPYSLLWLAARVDKTLRMTLPSIGREVKHDNTRMRQVLGIDERSLKDTVIDMGYSLIELGHVKKTQGYKPQHSDKS